MMDYSRAVKVDLDDLCELVRDSLILNRLYMENEWALEITGVDNLIYDISVTDDEVDEYVESLIIYD